MKTSKDIFLDAFMRGFSCHHGCRQYMEDIKTWEEFENYSWVRANDYWNTLEKANKEIEEYNGTESPDN